MNFLDMRTVILGHFFTNMLCTAVLAFVWVQNRKRFAGAGWWLSDFAFQSLAVALVILRGYLPDWVSIIVSNTLVVAGALLGYIGLTLFVGKKSPQLHNYTLLVVFALVHSYFVYVKPDLAARNLNLSLGLLIVCFQCVWLILQRVEPDMRRMARGVGNVFGMFCLVSFVRIVVALVNPSPSNDFFQSGLFDTIILVAYQILLILLAFSLITMVNQRLLVDIQFQEEKYATIFRSSPYAITLTRLSDGKILDVNDGFTVISGYSYDEVVGKTTLELKLWDREEDRAVVVGELSKGRRVLGREFQFRKKSGEMIIGRFSAEAITIHNQPWVLSSIDDITELKQVEKSLRESERRFRTAQDISLEAFTILRSVRDEQGQIVDFTWIYANAAAGRILKHPPEKLVGQRLLKVLPGNRENEALFHRYIRIVETGQGDEVELEYHSDNITGWFRNMTVKLDDGVAISFSDITERKRTETALSGSEKLLRAIADNYPNSYLSIVEKDLTIGFTSGQEFKKLNLDPNQFVGLTLEQVFGEYTPLVRENYLRAFDGAETQFELFINNQHQHYRTVPLTDQDGRVHRILVVVENITERKQAEEALRAHQQNLQALIENSEGSIWSVDSEYRLIIGNALYRKNVSSAIGRELHDRENLLALDLPQDALDEWQGYYDRALLGEKFNIQIRTRFRPVPTDMEYFFNPIRAEDDQITGVTVFGRDITERKQMENELHAQRHALAERLKELNCLYGVASLTETPHISLEEILQGTVELLPPAWQQPRQTCARLTLQEQTYQTSNFQQTDWRISSRITVNGSPIGMLEVFLLREPVHDDEVFLPEETKLLDAVAERISRLIERAGAEEALRENEIIFSSFLENSPVYVFFKDKNIRTLRLSRNYEQMLGMPVSETIGKSMDELFPSPLAQSMVADDLRILKEGKRVDIVEELNGRFYETTKFPIYMDGKPEMLAGFTMDITDRKRNETILQIRLKLLEFAAMHSLDELMQYALDEVGELTQSPIGFYHFVEPDEKTLSLQAWSTRTLQEFCQAEGKDLHYPIDQAGVWVDCIAQRKPVIHNDYESLPHRKGLPPGHAQVVRELVAPIFRDGRVVAILGVGNKPNDYDETDADSVSYIADVVFEIVKRKQAEEDLKKATEQLSLRLTEIEELHEALREQSIRDPLTGAYNRRYMQDVIMREFARAAREKIPVSVIMLDMDELKIFNDKYGHHIGDQAIKMLASHVKDMIRTEDIICRFGGDEFIIILGKTSPENAVKRVSEWREALNNHPLAVEGKKMPVQFTAGIASFPVHGSTMEEVINYADVALYRAKARGRNCTIVFA